MSQQYNGDSGADMGGLDEKLSKLLDETDIQNNKPWVINEIKKLFETKYAIPTWGEHNLRQRIKQRQDQNNNLPKQENVWVLLIF